MGAGRRPRRCHESIVGRALSLAALVMALSAGAAAGASASPVVVFTARAVPIPGWPNTGNHLGAGAGLRLEYGISGSEYGGHPPPLEAINLFFPKGMITHPSGFPTCAGLTPLEPHSPGPFGCPPGSQAGPAGSLLASVAFGSQVVPEAATSEPFLVPEGDLVSLIHGDEPMNLQLSSTTDYVAATGLYSHEMVSDFPSVETVPGAPKLSIEHLVVALGAAYRKETRSTYYLRMPRTCPKGGYPFKAELVFAAAGGIPQQTVTETHLAPCPPRGAAAGPQGLPAAAVLPLENAAPKLTAYGGYVVFSRREATGRWRLLAWHDGTVTPLKVPERVVPFDAEAGPSRSGSPTVVFSKCRRDPTLPDDWGKAAGCHVYELVLPGGTPKLIRGIYKAKASDTTPAIWRGLLAFARLRTGMRAPALYVWDRASGHLNLVGGGPAHCLAGLHEPCNTKPKVLAWVKEMSLGAGLLAFQWALPEAIPDFTADFQQIRADPLHGARQDGPTKVIASSVIGGACNGAEGGSPDVSGGRVLFYSHRSICTGLPVESFIDSYDFATRSYSRVGASPLAVAVAEDGAKTYWIGLAEGPNVHSEDGYAESCEPALSICTLMSSEDLAGELKPD